MGSGRQHGRAARVRRRCTLAAAGLALLASAAPAAALTETRIEDPNACVEGTPSTGWCGDGGPAAGARLASPGSIVALPDGGFAFADRLNSAVREVSASGRIRTLATLGGEAGCPPGQLALAPDGRLLAAAPGCANVVAITPDGTVSVLAGADPLAGAPSRSRLLAPSGVAVTPDGATLIADAGGIVRLDPDGSLHPLRLRPRIDATTLLATPDGRLLAAGESAGIVWRVDPASGRTRIVLGHPSSRRTAGGLLTTRYDRAVGQPAALAALPGGGFAFADRLHHRVRAVDATGRVRTLAGSGREGFDGDGGPASAARLAQPAGVAVRADGSLLIADASNDRIRRVSPSDATIETVAGSGQPPGSELAPPPDEGSSELGLGRVGCGTGGYCRSWNYFYIVEGSRLTFRRGRSIAVHVYTTRAADVVGVVLHRGRRTRRVRAHVGEGTPRIVIGSLAAANYVLELVGRASGEHKSFAAKLSIR